jgi:hypothetical protein
VTFCFCCIRHSTFFSRLTSVTLPFPGSVWNGSCRQVFGRLYQVLIHKCLLHKKLKNKSSNLMRPLFFFPRCRLYNIIRAHQWFS